MAMIENPFSQDARITGAMGRVAKAFLPSGGNDDRAAYYAQQAAALKDQRDMRADIALRPADTPLGNLMTLGISGGIDPTELNPYLVGREAIRRGPDGGFAADEETLSRLIFGTTGKGLGYREAATAGGRDTVHNRQLGADAASALAVRGLANEGDLAVQGSRNTGALAVQRATPLTETQERGQAFQGLSPIAQQFAVGPNETESKGTVAMDVATGARPPDSPEVRLLLGASGGRGGGQLLDVGGTDAIHIGGLIEQALGVARDKNGVLIEGSPLPLDPALQARAEARAAEIYQQTRNMTTAIHQAINEVIGDPTQLQSIPGKAGWLWDDPATARGLLPTSSNTPPVQAPSQMPARAPDAAPVATAPATGAAAGPPPGKPPEQLLVEANDAIARGADPAQVRARLQAWGIQVQ